MALYHVIAYSGEGYEYFFPNLPGTIAVAIHDVLDELGLEVELKKVVSN